MHYAQILALLVFGHMLADYPLQGDFLARAKNRLNPIQGVPWWQALAAHSVIQAGFVGIITGSVGLAVAEFCIHWITDDLKCRMKINFNTDQAIHLVCKLAWAGIAVAQ